MRDQSHVVALCYSLKKILESHLQNVNWSNVFLAHPKETWGCFTCVCPLCPILVSSGRLSCTEGWLKSHILYLGTGYGDSSSFSLCLNLQWGQPSAQSCLWEASGCSGACMEPPWWGFSRGGSLSSQPPLEILGRNSVRNSCFWGNWQKNFFWELCWQSEHPGIDRNEWLLNGFSLRSESSKCLRWLNPSDV